MSADERPNIATTSGHGKFASGGPQNSRGGEPPAWWIYRGTGRPLHDIDLRELLPPPPPWRVFGSSETQPLPPGDDTDLARRLGQVDNVRDNAIDPREVDAVNAALYLRRPLLVTGKPGVGKSSLAYRISRELRLGRVLRWPISSRSTVRSGLYEYDAIGRAQEAAAARAARAVFAEVPERKPPSESGRVEGGTEKAADAPDPSGIGDFIWLGPLGTALLSHELPRVLLIDELDKSDMDLPNDLLDIFEEGEFLIPELVRATAREPAVRVHTADPETKALVRGGHVRCRAFPIVIITSNAEREFPAAFLRRCLRFHMQEPAEERLAGMVAAHFMNPVGENIHEMLYEFLEYRRVHGGLAIDQLLNAVFLATSGADTADASWQRLLDLVWQRLSDPEVVTE